MPQLRVAPSTRFELRLIGNQRLLLRIEELEKHEYRQTDNCRRQQIQQNHEETSLSSLGQMLPHGAQEIPSLFLSLKGTVSNHDEAGVKPKLNRPWKISNTSQPGPWK